MKVSEIVEHFRPGSHDKTTTGKPWGWQEELTDLELRGDGENNHLFTVCDVIQAAEAKNCRDFVAEGFEDKFSPMWIGTPAVLGYDGRLWDGHYRICALLLLGWLDVQVPVHFAHYIRDETKAMSGHVEYL